MDPHTRQLQALVESRGVIQSSDLQKEFGISQATASRLLRRTDLPLVRIGRGRSTRYSLLRHPFTAPIPLYRIDPRGRPERIAILAPLVRGQYYVEAEANEAQFWLSGTQHGMFEDLPYYLGDMAPQGFLGREIARQLGTPYPADPRRWSANQTFDYLLETNNGADASGDLVLGDRALERAQRQPPVIAANMYSEMATAILAGNVGGSSAGGEHPKFTAYTEHAGHVIVKFSPREDGSIATRWRDILIAEHLAAQTLREAGLPATASTIYEQDGRCFLEVSRFDRAGVHGRLPMLSLKQLDAEFVGHGSDWVGVMHSLAEQGLVDQASYERTLQYQWFGQWIGNTDMHLGNLSLAPQPGSRQFRLLPAYDMAPMRFAPERGEIPPLTLPRPPVRLPRYAGLWEEMRQLAASYWTGVCQDPRISDDFRRIALRCLEPMENPAPDTHPVPAPGS